MYYKLLSFVCVSQGAVRFLPIEIIAMILRYLDDSSLFSAFLTCRRWAEVCRGDPILRRRIRNHVKNIRKERERVILNPSTGIEIVRTENTSIFERNRSNNKQIKVERDILPQMVRLPKIKKEVYIGPIRSKSYVRHSPYKRLRL
ncbi:hypothetical protein HHI36_023220 [Cryptolaemus montrouzieri]|uniref:F-box domain-containing protein n=1 Tax=Cryptolaemus montrouzieri TaxID=559131 RepID=A0ABD2PFY3_9CUCU